ncbi:TMEM164 family acyltransferase [Actinomyces culturomici]
MLVVSLAQQCLLYGAYLAAGWDWSEALPLHVSRISAILGIVYLATGSKRVMDVLFYFGLWSWFSFLYPSQVQPITNVFGWSFVINHTITLLMPVLAWVTTDWRPSRRALHRAFAWLVATRSSPSARTPSPAGTTSISGTCRSWGSSVNPGTGSEPSPSATRSTGRPTECRSSSIAGTPRLRRRRPCSSPRGDEAGAVSPRRETTRPLGSLERSGPGRAGRRGRAP